MGRILKIDFLICAHSLCSSFSRWNLSRFNSNRKSFIVQIITFFQFDMKIFLHQDSDQDVKNYQVWNCEINHIVNVPEPVLIFDWKCIDLSCIYSIIPKNWPKKIWTNLKFKEVTLAISILRYWRSWKENIDHLRYYQSWNQVEPNLHQNRSNLLW